MNETLTLTAIDRARAFAERHHIDSRAAWIGSGMVPWRIYEQFKRELADEVPPSSDDWRPAVRLLTDVLHV